MVLELVEVLRAVLEDTVVLLALVLALALALQLHTAVLRMATLMPLPVVEAEAEAALSVDPAVLVAPAPIFLRLKLQELKATILQLLVALKLESKRYPLVDATSNAPISRSGRYLAYLTSIQSKRSSFSKVWTCLRTMLTLVHPRISVSLVARKSVC